MRLKFLFLVLSLLYSPIQGQSDDSDFGIPLITNYLPKDYKADVQCWSVVQDKRGVMYFSNFKGVLEYDGVHWRLIPIPNGIARSLAIDEDGVIYVGGFNEVGYLAPDASGRLAYKSLNKYFSSDANVDFGEVWTIFPRNSGLYVQTISTLYLLKSDKNSTGSFLNKITALPTIEKWISRTKINPILSIGERIFVQERGIGIQELSGGKLQMLPEGELFANDMIFVMLPYPGNEQKNNKILVGSSRRGLFLFDGKKFEKFNNEAEDYLAKNRLYFRGALLADDNIALGTQHGGIIVIDRNGKLKKIIDKKAGLSNNSVWDLYYDREGNLWAGLDNGIAKILYPSPISMIDERFGYEGTIINIYFFNEYLYLATASGLFYSRSTENFKQINGISVQSWRFQPFNDKLLAATNSGLFELNGPSAEFIETNLRYTNIVYRSKTNPGIIYVGMYDGVAILKYEEGKLKYSGHIPVMSNRLSDFAEDRFGDLWCIEMSGRIFYVKTPRDKNDLASYKLINPQNQPVVTGELKMFQFRDTIYFYTSVGIYTYDYQAGKLVTSEILKDVLPAGGSKLMSIISDEDEILWCLINDQDKALILEVDKNNNKVSRHNFLELVKDKIPSEVFGSIIYSQTGKKKVLWVGATNTIIKYDPSSNLVRDEASFIKPGIRGVAVNDSSVFGGYTGSINKDVEFPPSAASITFEYSLPSFINEYGNDYQYLLEGFDGNWSGWSNAAKKEYTNLSSGDYTFKVRSRNAAGQISDIAEYKFRILPPWYRTWWVNLAGFLILLTFLNFLVRYRVEYLRKRNIILEKIVNERTAKINEQKEILEKQAEKLREMDQIKSNFFANISHEFRTPLTLIKGQLENVVGMLKDENIKKRLIIAFNNSNRLHRLINQILDLSKMESGKIKLDLEVTDIIKLLYTRIASFESLAEKNKVALILTKKIESLLLNVDKARIEEVIDNLLSNALKFTPANGTIDVSVDLEKSGFGESAVIKIRDTGIGITADKLIHIFDRFYQADDSSTRQHQGTGLGLAIVKDLVELHGGSITAESKVNSGTCFKILLPVEEIEVVNSNIEEFPDKDVVKSDEEKPLILIVEDNSDMRAYIRENLEVHYRIEEAGDGREGISKAIERIPDLIITDVMMPCVDGFELCTTLKHDQKTSHIPIIILTAKADEENKLGGLLIGADEFLAKPFSPRELEIRVGNLIHIRQLLREKYKEISVIKSEDVKASPIDKDFLAKVFNEIKVHLEDQQFSVQFLAGEIGMSVSQLNRKLNALINQSAGKLIRSTRLDYSAKLLEKNAGNITEIAYRIGFADVSSYTNSFKEKYGVSPSEYLKNKVNNP